MYLEDIEIIKQIENSPKGMMIFQSLQKFFQEEEKRRMEFYESVTEDQKAEFINGEKIIHSPVKLQHSRTSFALANSIFNFIKNKNIGEVHHEKLMIRLTRNDYEPDVCYFGYEKSKNFKPEQLLFPAPDFIAEVISKSTENIDKTIKFEDYQNHGVQEYWIIDPEKKFIEQYQLIDNKYQLIKKTDTGIMKCKAIEGFEVNAENIFK